MGNVNINMNAVNRNCGIIRQVGMTPGLAGQFFTISAKGVIKDYAKIKEEIDSNPQTPEVFITRQIRSFDIKSHVVLSQAVETDAAGNVKVVFNPGTDDEAKATVVAGAVGFGEPTADALKKALASTDNNVIFANGKKLLKETNDLIDSEIAWVDALINRLNRAKQTLENSKNDNARKVNEYLTALAASTPKETVSIGGNTVEIEVTNTDE